MPEPVKRLNLHIGPSEVLYLTGLILLFSGLALWQGIGVALTTCGAVLIITGLLSAVIEDLGAQHAI
jgi:hypothetical protein